MQRDFVTADLRGLKAALEARAAAERVSVSSLIRRAVAREFGEPAPDTPPASGACRAQLHKISLRLSRPEIDRLDGVARRERLSRSAVVSRCLQGEGLPRTDQPSGQEILASLTACTAEMATLGRGLHRMATLLVRADVEAARPYRQMLGSLDRDVRAHLEVSARALASFRPAARVLHPSSDIKGDRR